MAKTLVILADGFEESEGIIIIDLLRRGKRDVDTASIGEGKTVHTSHGLNIEADIMLKNANEDDYDRVVLPGGLKGVNNLKQSNDVTRLLKSFAKNGKKLAAICAGPTVLAAAGLLNGRKSTVYPGMDNELTGAEYHDEAVVVDGNITTGRALGAAIEFSLELLKQDCSEEMAAKVSKDIVNKV